MAQISLFASAVRPNLWNDFFVSLRSNVREIEVVFAGNAKGIRPDSEDWWYPSTDLRMSDMERFKYIETGNIKPAQCYEIARRNCTGEVVVWVADDCEFPNGVLDKSYEYWKSQGNEKLILSIQTRETGYHLAEGMLFDMTQHGFFGFCPDTPLMAPLGMMSRKFLEELGGLDRRYVCGQYENDIVMRAYSQGGKVEIFGGKDAFIDIDHLGKSLKIGESKVEEDFLNRPFAKGYPEDRAILERSWAKFNQNKLQILSAQGFKQVKTSQVFDISKNQLDKFEPYNEENILIKSQSNKGGWE